MKFQKLIYTSCLAVALIAAAAGVQSCRDDIFDVPDYTRTGEDVRLTLPITLPVMDARTRASLDEASLNQVESLWIRTYSADTGLPTSDWYEWKGGTTTDQEPTAHDVQIETKSGSSYIVAVANVNNLGVTPATINNPQPLSELLAEADTWQKFLEIAVVAPSNQENVRAPEAPLPMAGCYSDIKLEGPHQEPATPIANWQNLNFQPYFIPATSSGTVDFTGTGAIHLRRLVSHLNFNVIPGNDNIEITVNSYQVMNAPRFSWLYERPGDKTNFGDLAASEADAATFYTDVPQYGSQYVSDGTTAGSSAFDFWQSENKHTGTANTYHDRDKRAVAGSPYFTSLTGGNNWSANNQASYVLISCTIDYKNQVNVNGQGEIVDEGGQLMNRTGEVTYLVHLGYIGDGADADKSKDFNCFRNVDYTYNITVNSINDIRVDAYATDETYHGEEGLVVDLTNATIELDGHYAAFNVQLTQAELEAANFGFIITTYDNGVQYTVTDANRRVGSNQSTVIYERDGVTVIPEEYYNWIELRPTTGANVLAEYKPRYGTNADGGTFLLTDLQSGENTSAWASMTGAMRSASGYYTVFVNEYTYEPMYTGRSESYANETWNQSTSARPAWAGYVNQNPRRFYIRVTQKTSKDGNSVYARSKYGISQQSLMTYYSTQNISGTADGTAAGSALALERINETEGMNLRMGYSYIIKDNNNNDVIVTGPGFKGGTSTDNGRWNTAQYLNDSETSTDLSINSATDTNRPKWSRFIVATSPLEVGAVGSERAQGGPTLPARTIASGNPEKLPALVKFTQGATFTFCDPQGNNDYTIEAINACMNRNRDNNGNGYIERDELRWYVPAMDKYLAIILGEAALSEPLMDFHAVDQLPHVNENSWSGYAGSITNDFYSRYMAVASNSDRNVMWLMEGTSISEYGMVHKWSGGKSYPWQVRCVRNLGTNLSSNIREDDRVGIPYVHNEATRTFAMSYFVPATIRANSYSGNGTGATQMPVHTITSPYNNMYRAFEYAASDIDVSISDADPVVKDINGVKAYIDGNPCGSLTGTGWRVPNQEELTLMRNVGLFLNSPSPNRVWLSCTVNYFNYNNGVGSSTNTAERYFLVVTPTQGTQLTGNNFILAKDQDEKLYVRCVRDRNL